MKLATLAVFFVLVTAPALAYGVGPAALDPPTPLAAPAAEDAAARAFVRALPRATAVNDADADKVFDALEAEFALAAPGARLPVIVLARDGEDPRAALAHARAAVGRAFEAERVFSIVPGFAARLSLDEALRVAALPAIRQVEANAVGAPELATATVVTGVRAVQNGLGVTGDLDGLPAFTPADVTIAVLDTGFDGKHVDLGEGKLVRFVEVATGKTAEAYDSGSHGTHVASIAAGLGRGDPANVGVAPGAGVLGLKIVPPQGSGKSTADTAIAAIEYAVAHKEELNVRVLTISFGFGRATDGTTAMELAMDAAWDAGIVCFKSLGNSGPGRATVTVPGAARGIMGIGAMLDVAGTEIPLVPEEVRDASPGTFALRGMQLAGFSSRGPTADGRVKPDLVAPGFSIEAAYAGTKDGYASFSGTSMASPFAAGVAALVIAANPALTPDDVRDVMRGTAEEWGVEGPDVDYGWGRVDALAAVGRALALAAKPVPEVEPPVVPRHESRAGVLDNVGVAQHEVTVTAEDAGNPIALTFIVEGAGLALTVLDPAGNPVLDSALGGVDAGTRQMVRGFNATDAGTYTVVAHGTPLAPFSLDVAFGAVPATSLLAAIPEGLPEGVLPAATDGGGALVPSAGALAAALALVAAAGAAGSLRRRR